MTMTTETHAPHDRTGWPPGPWDGEPDRVEFKHEGVPCLLTRGPMGHWCAYAACEPGHPWHGFSDTGTFDDDSGYMPSPFINIDAHGGITYADKCQGHVCHVPDPGEPEDVWWLGMDFAHHGDMTPHDAKSATRFGRARTGTYATVDVARGWACKLAEQIVAARGGT